MLMFEKRIGPKPGIFTVCSGPASQSIGRGRLSREGALDVRKSPERRDKIVPKKSPEEQEKRNFGMKFSIFLKRIACCSRESTSAWQNFRQKNEKEEFICGGSRFFFISGRAHIPFSVGNLFHFFGRGKTNFWGDGISSTLASQWPSWGIYKHAPPVFWRKSQAHFFLLLFRLFLSEILSRRCRLSRTTSDPAQKKGENFRPKL